MCGLEIQAIVWLACNLIGLSATLAFVLVDVFAARSRR